MTGIWSLCHCWSNIFARCIYGSSMHTSVLDPRLQLLGNLFSFSSRRWHLENESLDLASVF